MGNSLVSIFLPDPSWPTQSTRPSLLTVNILTTESPGFKLIPFTPSAVRPTIEISDSGNRTDLPPWVNIRTSQSPSVMCTSSIWSPAFTFPAIIPPLRGWLYSEIAVLLTIPFLVTETMKELVARCSAGMSLTIASFLSAPVRAYPDLPREFIVPSVI